MTVVNTRALPPLNQFGPQCADGVPSNPPVCFDYNPYLTTVGNGPNLFSPEWSYNFSVSYDFYIGADTILTPRLNYAYVGSRWTNYLYDPATDYLAAHGLLSGLVSLRVHDWMLEIYGNNLTDKKYVSGQSGNNEFYGAPREYGVRVSTHF